MHIDKKISSQFVVRTHGLLVYHRGIMVAVQIKCFTEREKLRWSTA
ncbi:MAG: hypothetical protein GF363_11835 [Chitinivibrionales bacterium]|nr:hypothetical protein [Chitinivibrionales bacterium]